jgi:hypothetical protein
MTAAEEVEYQRSEACVRLRAALAWLPEKYANGRSGVALTDDRP